MLTEINRHRLVTQILGKRAKSKFGFRYNWKPDLPDQRDLLFSEFAASSAVVPEKVDLRSSCSPVFDQGKIGSCTGNAIAGSVEFLELKDLKSKATVAASDPYIFDPRDFTSVSRLFIYYNERLLEGKTNEDSGATIRDGMKSLTKFGVCPEDLCTYSETNVTKSPSDKAYEDAASHKISQYLRVKDLTELKQSLASGFPVVFGFTVYESFESPAVARSGLMPMPNADEQVMGGHAVMCVGFDDATNHLIVRNSWGEEWGDHGYFYMPYEYMESAGLAKDFWTLRTTTKN